MPAGISSDTQKYLTTLLLDRITYKIVQSTRTMDSVCMFYITNTPIAY